MRDGLIGDEKPGAPSVRIRGSLGESNRNVDLFSYSSCRES